jgi:hypothetical protein
MSNTPRFGHERDFSVLFSGDKNQRSDYLWGLIFAGALTLMLFLAWGVTLLVFRCFSPQRVGFLSGQPFVLNAPDPDGIDNDERINQSLSVDSNHHNGAQASYYIEESPTRQSFGGSAEYIEDIKHNQKPIKVIPFWNRPKRIRVTFLFCGLTYVTFSALLVAKGVTDLQNTVTTLNVSAQNINLIATEARDIIQNGIRKAADVAYTVRKALTTELNTTNFCPADPTAQNSNVASQFSDSAAQATDLLNQLDNFAAQPLTEADTALATVEKGCNDVEDFSGSIDLTSWETLVVLVPYVIVPALLTSGCILALFNVSLPRFDCFINWFVLPLFIIMNIVSFVVASLMLVAAGVNTDFCLPVRWYIAWVVLAITSALVSFQPLCFLCTAKGGQDSSPDESVYSIMTELGYNGTFAFRVVQYFVSQCKAGNDPFGPIRDFVPELVSPIQ